MAAWSPKQPQPGRNAYIWVKLAFDEILCKDTRLRTVLLQVYFACHIYAYTTSYFTGVLYFYSFSVMTTWFQSLKGNWTGKGLCVNVTEFWVFKKRVQCLILLSRGETVNSVPLCLCLERGRIVSHKRCDWDQIPRSRSSQPLRADDIFLMCRATPSLISCGGAQWLLIC